MSMNVSRSAGLVFCVLWMAAESDATIIQSNVDMANLRIKADAGDAEAQFQLGVEYGNGERIQRTLDLAAKYCRMSAAQLHPGGSACVGFMMANGLGMPVDTQRGLEMIKASAALGHRSAQYYLGQAYETGTGVTRDEAEALKWLSLSAAQGLAGAQYRLALRYADGKGVEKDPAKAVKLMRLAADQEWVNARVALGRWMMKGDLVAKDQAGAVQLFGRAAQQRSADGHYELAVATLQGAGTTKNSAEAAKLFRFATDLGHVDAPRMLADLYSRGEGVPTNAEEAARLHKLALNRGNEIEKAVADIDDQIARWKAVAKSFREKEAEQLRKAAEAKRDRDKHAASSLEFAILIAQTYGLVPDRNGQYVSSDPVVEKAFTMFERSAGIRVDRSNVEMMVDILKDDPLSMLRMFRFVPDASGKYYSEDAFVEKQLAAYESSLRMRIDRSNARVVAVLTNEALRKYRPQ